MRFFKKNTENKTTSKLPMTGKVKKGYRAYCVAVLAMTVVLGTRCNRICGKRPYHGSKQSVRFHFRTYPCNRTYPARLRYCAGGSLVEKPRPVSESERLSDPCRRYHHHFRKGNPYPYHRLIENWHRGRIGKTVRPQICIRRCER